MLIFYACGVGDEGEVHVIDNRGIDYLLCHSPHSTALATVYASKEEPFQLPEPRLHGYTIKVDPVNESVEYIQTCPIIVEKVEYLDGDYVLELRYFDDTYGIYLKDNRNMMEFGCGTFTEEALALAQFKHLKRRINTKQHIVGIGSPYSFSLDDGVQKNPMFCSGGDTFVVVGNYIFLNGICIDKNANHEEAMDVASILRGCLRQDGHIHLYDDNGKIYKFHDGIFTPFGEEG